MLFQKKKEPVFETDNHRQYDALKRADKILHDAQIEAVGDDPVWKFIYHTRRSIGTELTQIFDLIYRDPESDRELMFRLEKERSR